MVELVYVGVGALKISRPAVGGTQHGNGNVFEREPVDAGNFDVAIAVVSRTRRNGICTVFESVNVGCERPANIFQHQFAAVFRVVFGVNHFSEAQRYHVASLAVADFYIRHAREICTHVVDENFVGDFARADCLHSFNRANGNIFLRNEIDVRVINFLLDAGSRVFPRAEKRSARVERNNFSVLPRLDAIFAAGVVNFALK